MSHRWSVVGIALAIAAVGIVAFAGQPGFGRGGRSVWTPIDRMPAEADAAPPGVRPEKFAAFKFDRDAMAAVLRRAPLEDTPEAARPIDVPLPMPDGSIATFKAVEAPIMAPELQARYPQIRTYLGWRADDLATTARFDLTPLGFHAQVITPGGFIYVDPYSALDRTGHYASYWLRDWRAPDWLCQVPAGELSLPDPDPEPTDRAGPTRRTYRAAVAATVEFTTLYGGTVASGLSAVTTAMNRTTGIYEVEAAIRFQLVANNDLLIYTAATGDPYTNSNNSTMLSENQTNLNNVIGFANYDIGHVFGTAGGGVAQLGVVSQTNKARGVSANFFGASDPANTLTVAHEMGHQFNAAHSWNGTNSGCTAGQWGGSSQALEPGSGNTIMSYGGSCGADNYNPASRDAYFSSGSFDRILAWAMGSGTPFLSEATGNTAPTISAGSNFTIPARTPFVLTATGSDANGDSITYCWEQRNGSSQFALAAGDPGNGPIIRSFPAVASSARTVPNLFNLLSNTFTPGEILPTTTRTLNFRVTARDNRAGNGGVNTSDMTISVVNTGSPFRVIYPNILSSSISGVQTVTWNVANTNLSPINTANVRILLSTDGGNTWPTTLLASTPNNGSAQVTLPQISSTTARIRVEAVNNIYFDVSDANFTITPALSTINLTLGGVIGLSDPLGSGNDNGNGVADPGENWLLLTVPIQNRGLTTATGVSATLTSLTGTATVIDAASAYPDLANNVVGVNAAAFRIALASNHPCGTPVSLRLNVTSAQGPATINFSLPVGNPASFTFNGATAIPDNSTNGVLVPLVVSGVPGSISDVNFRFGGTSCNTTSTSTSVGLNHSFTGELVVTLISPSGTAVKLIDFLTGGLGDNPGNNFCQTVLDDQSGGASIQSLTSANAPYTGAFTPANPLGAFNGQPANGTWLLRVQDLAAGDTGTVRNFSLTFNNAASTVCQPPATIPSCSPADVATEGSLQPFIDGPDGFITGTDFDVFVQGFFQEVRRPSPAGPYIADLTDDTGTGGPDSFITGADFDKFISLFFAGCP
ncbi:MAG: proprotein convertase P-domain-containing protein [Phycisphaerae bacterium]|nr:proprotein convertase P-domain-containing protein [Phycisphaerae bacterium]